jgi:radical SAM superfamily enzyme YgiQ (UPF0313 family)
MKILLINPPIREWAQPNVLPLGLGYLAAITRKAGHEVEVMDINAFRQTVQEKIRCAEFDVIGIGAIVTVYKYVKWLTGVIKSAFPDKKIMIGGSVGTSIPHIIMEKTLADIVCIGEGEETIVDLLGALETGQELSSVDGIWFKDREGNVQKTPPRLPMKDLDAIPFPAWDLFPMDIYLKNPVGAPNRNKWGDGRRNDGGGLSMNISATRGCPYQCIYCYHDFMGHGYRHRSPENVVEEIKSLRDRYGVSYVHFIDDEFCLNKKFVAEFCALMTKNFRRALTWGCTGRVNLMTETLISAMAEAGCVLLCYGIESGSQRMLDVMKKGVRVEEAKTAIRLTQKFMGWADCSFMIGLPGENYETIRETVDFCKDLQLAPEVVFFATPYPGTELYHLALAQGKIEDEEDYVLNLGEQGEQIRVNFSELSDAELYAVQEAMIRELGAWNKMKHCEQVIS